MKSTSLVILTITTSFCLGFGFGLVGIFISIFFVELYTPWVYLWACFGMVMRLALTAPWSAGTVNNVPPAALEPALQARADAFGWRASRESARPSASDSS